MRTIFQMILFAVFACVASPVKTVLSDEPTHLFILSGQSNMNGLKPADSFIPTLQETFGPESIVVVKDSHGGQPIRRWYHNWQPDKAASAAPTGDLYDALMDKVEAAIAGRSFDSVTFLWMQGEKDAREGNAARYANAFRGVLNQLRRDLQHEEINFVIGRLSDFGMEHPKYPEWLQMRRVQMNLAQASQRGSWVDTDDLNDGAKADGRMVVNDLHYTVEGYKELGRRMAVAAIDLVSRHDLETKGAEPDEPGPYAVVPEVRPPYYRIRYPASGLPDQLHYPVRYTIWIPPGIDQLRGVVVHQHGCGEGSCRSGLTGAFDLHWQALAQRHHCALLAPTYEQPQESPCYRWCDPRFGSGDTFIRGLKDLAELTEHPELTEVPWALWGHSGGASWVGILSTLYPERVLATWMRSGSAPTQVNPDNADVQEVSVTDALLKVPMMLNLGTKEGVTVTEGRFAKVWPSQERMFNLLRPKGALIGVAVDPLTSHECGNQRYLAIPWLDECLKQRLPEKAGQPLRDMPSEQAWLVPVLGSVAVPASQYSGDASGSVWLPNGAVAKAWMQYSERGDIDDQTPPPAPRAVEVTDGKIVWKAQADLQSGVERFVIYRDGQFFAQVPEEPSNRFGRPLFQGLQYSDTPIQPLRAMRLQDSSIKAVDAHRYEIATVNTVGLSSSRSSPSKGQ